MSSVLAEVVINADQPLACVELHGHKVFLAKLGCCLLSRNCRRRASLAAEWMLPGEGAQTSVRSQPVAERAEHLRC